MYLGALVQVLHRALVVVVQDAGGCNAGDPLPGPHP